MPITVFKFFLLLIGSIFCNVTEEMCEQYGEAVYVEEDSPLLLRNSLKVKQSECGIVSVPLIIGGTKAAPKEFPHMALIGFGSSPKGEIFWFCGGALISELYILTAAHCMAHRDKGPAQKIKLGALAMSTEDAQERLVDKRLPHPDYHFPRKYNDIALIRMDVAVDFTAYIRPACLYVEKQINDTVASAIGFGKTSTDIEEVSEFLMKVYLTIQPGNYCTHLYRHDTIVLPKNVNEESMICAGESAGGKDTCQGDSGGPLQIVLEDPYCMYAVVGVTSFGKFCGLAKSYGIYTRVSYYIPWIESIVW